MKFCLFLIFIGCLVYAGLRWRDTLNRWLERGRAVDIRRGIRAALHQDTDNRK